MSKDMDARMAIATCAIALQLCGAGAAHVLWKAQHGSGFCWYAAPHADGPAQHSGPGADQASHVTQPKQAWRKLVQVKGRHSGAHGANLVCL